MNKSILKSMGKCLLFGILWSVVLYLIALIIVNIKAYKIQDILFVEGIGLALIVAFSSIGGNSMGLSMQGLGQNNAQYIANANLEISKMEKNKIGNIKSHLSIGFSTITLVISAVLLIILSYII